ncbi:MAG: anthranilate phosphoribosyltransferase [Candidatus Dormibacteria bacterium]
MREFIEQLLGGNPLDRVQAAGAMRRIMTGEESSASVAGFLVALRMSGETPDEVAGMAEAMLDGAVRVDAGPDLVDTCGTGGDRSDSFNISTLAALVAAGAGARVAKHGNRAASSACGSADLLEALGVPIELDAAGVATCIREAGIGFMFAPSFHPATRHAGEARRALGTRTVFNLLGPLTNPARPRAQVVGVPDPALGPLMAQSLLRLGRERALVVHGHGGLDELTCSGVNQGWRVSGGEVHEVQVDPRRLGLAHADNASLRGGTASTNAELARRVLAGQGGPARDVVLLNAAAALWMAGVSERLEDGLERAAESLDSGAAGTVLERWILVGNRAVPA